MANYEIVFDNVMLKQLNKLGKDAKLKEIVSRMLDKIESLGPQAGKLLDPKLGLFEVKNNRPAVRLYYKIVKEKNEAHVFEYEIKTNLKKQNRTIQQIKNKILKS